MRVLVKPLLVAGCIYVGGFLFNDPHKNGESLFLALLFFLFSIFTTISLIRIYESHDNLEAYEVSRRYNLEHLRKLSEGAVYWNVWRKEQKIESPELADIRFWSRNFNDYDLSRAELADAEFEEVDLNRANLSQARLVRTKFKDVGLCNANLSEAYLADTMVEFTDFRNADFTKAIIEHVTFKDGTQITGADFSQAQIFDVGFIDIDLRGVKGLETVIHGGPSTIDFNTINRSKGAIPEVFLRGTGARHALIDAIHSLKPIEYYSCFISYSSKDEEFATHLHSDLVAKGVRCWFAPHDMKTGDKIRTRIDEAVLGNEKLLLVLSEHSIGSQWVEQEVETALDKERETKEVVLFPISLDNKIMETKIGWPAHIRRTRHITDFQQWKNQDNYQRMFDRLLHDLIMLPLSDHQVTDRTLSDTRHDLSNS